MARNRGSVVQRVTRARPTWLAVATLTAMFSIGAIACSFEEPAPPQATAAAHAGGGVAATSQPSPPSPSQPPRPSAVAVRPRLLPGPVRRIESTFELPLRYTVGPDWEAVVDRPTFVDLAFGIGHYWGWRWNFSIGLPAAASSPRDAVRTVTSVSCTWIDSPAGAPIAAIEHGWFLCRPVTKEDRWVVVADVDGRPVVFTFTNSRANAGPGGFGVPRALLEELNLSFGS